MLSAVNKLLSGFFGGLIVLSAVDLASWFFLFFHMVIIEFDGPFVGKEFISFVCVVSSILHMVLKLNITNHFRLRLKKQHRELIRPR